MRPQSRVSAAPYPAQGQPVEIAVVDVKAVEKGLRSLDDILIGSSGVFAVLQVGGFLGAGGRLVAVPMPAFQYVA